MMIFAQARFRKHPVLGRQPFQSLHGLSEIAALTIIINFLCQGNYVRYTIGIFGARILAARSGATRTTGEGRNFQQSSGMLSEFGSES
ncbi:hypothetical protein Pmar_PMAR027983 [Perkinsus marinus ATCC 50983]|uniref:Uncharacterized protein n=1 Tax=Perkinsus marinus (strain ATCC 50983 / TXsc) TaxID=423536 RepID=C5LV83_PERM5|nr:hypothetical protein Pmar_PMAR027983 [Perkinsus marinus ATCC 50983]EEQ99321.1 hypothetical protein Pmar_PMAR027983 [Perkinsus marinus ATCC 50983]|eukprot:XP_002766604.1 hypothetical protein Pmar_PMAR027983 [Perkinsus marinus ATCC 50983]